ncbi:MAG: imidazole glycerol phosphate synthase subunit HisH [Alphaproteobacteria bacterium]
MTIVAIIDHGSGNLRSAEKSFRRAAAHAGVDCDIIVTDRPEKVAAADQVVLPGVGAFADCRAGIQAIDGLFEALVEAVKHRARPFFGICVGMQLMATRGAEHQPERGFGWIPGSVEQIQPSDPTLKVPHMGWNTLDLIRPHPVFSGLKLGPQGAHAYFVHSFQLVADGRQDVLATTDHGGAITAAVARDNMVGTQFHPEKSQEFGLALIANFLRWRP